MRQALKRIGGKAGAEPPLHIGDPNPWNVDEGLRRRQTLLQRRHPGDRFQRVLRCDQPPHFVEIQQVKRRAAGKQMAFVGGVERTAEQADPAACRKSE